MGPIEFLLLDVMCADIKSRISDHALVSTAPLNLAKNSVISLIMSNKIVVWCCWLGNVHYIEIQTMAYLCLCFTVYSCAFMRIFAYESDCKFHLLQGVFCFRISAQLRFDTWYSGKCILLHSLHLICIITHVTFLCD